jgi:hypothetical protein
MIIGPILITLLGWQVAVEAVQCGADVEDLVRHLSPKLSSPETLLTRCSAPAAFGRAVQGWNAPGDPRDYGQAPALVVRPTGKLANEWPVGAVGDEHFHIADHNHFH